jgi:hypothetical protein
MPRPCSLLSSPVQVAGPSSSEQPKAVRGAAKARARRTRWEGVNRPMSTTTTQRCKFSSAAANLRGSMAAPHVGPPHPDGGAPQVEGPTDGMQGSKPAALAQGPGDGSPVIWIPGPAHPFATLHRRDAPLLPPTPRPPAATGDAPQGLPGLTTSEQSLHYGRVEGGCWGLATGGAAGRLRQGSLVRLGILGLSTSSARLVHG